MSANEDACHRDHVTGACHPRKGTVAQAEDKRTAAHPFWTSPPSLLVFFSAYRTVLLFFSHFPGEERVR